MNKRREYAGIDWFRLIAAFFIVAIHTAPFQKINGTADYLITYCLGRVAVPFFLMVTGYFVLSGMTAQYTPEQGKKLGKYLLRLLCMYVGVTLLYLPVTIYAGNLPKGFGGWLKWFFMDGTFYHLWYLPAALIGGALTAVLLAFLPLWGSGVIVVVLYVIGMLGDSYYGAISNLEPLHKLYDFFFSFSSYTRNGIFFAPVFLWLGAVMAKRRREAGKGNRRAMNNGMIWLLFLLFLILMMTEGFLTWHFDLQKHNSMYLFLLPVMYFLMRGLLSIRGSAPKMVRSMSMWVYLLHPLCIVVVRGGAKVIKQEKILVDNNLVFYLLVCAFSLLAAFILVRLIGLARGLLEKRKVSGAATKG